MKKRKKRLRARGKESARERAEAKGTGEPIHRRGRVASLMAMYLPASTRRPGCLSTSPSSAETKLSIDSYEQLRAPSQPAPTAHHSMSSAQSPTQVSSVAGGHSWRPGQCHHPTPGAQRGSPLPPPKKKDSSHLASSVTADAGRGQTRGPSLRRATRAELSGTSGRGHGGGCFGSSGCRWRWAASQIYTRCGSGAVVIGCGVLVSVLQAPWGGRGAAWGTAWGPAILGIAAGLEICWSFQGCRSAVGGVSFGGAPPPAVEDSCSCMWVTPYLTLACLCRRRTDMQGRVGMGIMMLGVCATVQI